MFPGVLASAEATTPHACSRVFPGTAAQVREARIFLAEFLNDYPAVDDALVCLSELVTNAVIHSNSRRPGGTFTVSAAVSVGGLRVEVRDQGGAWAHPGHGDDHAHGRGLLIVSELALKWGRAGDPVSGWTVWFEIECHAPERQPSAGGAGQRWIVVLDGRRLRELRRKHGLSQAGLAGRAGVSVSVISRLERQACGSCRSRTLARLAAALGEEPVALASEPGSSSDDMLTVAALVYTVAALVADWPMLSSAPSALSASGGDPLRTVMSIGFQTQPWTAALLPAGVLLVAAVLSFALPPRVRGELRAA